MTFLAPSLPLLDDPRAPTAQDDRPGCGCILVERLGKRLSLPLRSVSFAATVVERVAEVTVEQVFENPHADLLEAVYIFPLSGNAAVSRFELHVGDKQLVGIVDERGEARRQYQVAIAEGRKAALLEQERDDVFTVKIGNLPPHERAKIKLVYNERLPAFDDGETELRVPLVVAPRYIPGAQLERASTGDGVESDTNAVPDASRISPPRLAPGLRGDVALSISVELLGESEVQDLGCTQHATRLGMGSGRLTVKLAKQDELLDRDFVLRWKSAGAAAQPFLYVTRKGGHTYGLLSLVPPREVQSGAGARDVLFLLDRSGSMQGEKLESAKRATAALLGTLAPQDRFALCAFDDGAKWFRTVKSEKRGDTFFQASASSRNLGNQWLAALSSGGGTQLLPALDESLQAIDALARESDSEGRVPIIVLVTDGQVGNEGEVLRRVEQRAQGLRVFTLGIDTAVNAAFLRRLAQIGRGTATLCEPGPALESALQRIGREIGAPVLVDVAVEDQGLGIDQATLTPERLPDLYAGRTASVFFRCTNATGAVRIRARRASGGSFDQVVQAQALEIGAIPQLWAKARVSDLEDRYRLAYGGATGGLEAARGQILDLALEHQLLTRFTAFLVVDKDEAARRLALPRRTVVQAVEQPKGWAQRDALADAADPFAATAQTIFRKLADPFAAPAFAPPPPAARPTGGMPRGAAGSLGGSDRASAFDPFAGGGDDAFAADLSAHAAPGADPFGAPGSVGGMDELSLEDEAPSDARFSLGPPSPARAGSARSAPPPSGSRPAPQAPGSEGSGTVERLKRALFGSPKQEAAKRDAGDASFGGRDAKAKRAEKSGSPAPSLEVLVEALGKELANVLSELEQGRWPQHAELERLRDETLRALDASGLAARTARTHELLFDRLARVVACLKKHKGKPADEAVDLVRAVAEALAAQCRAELAPLLGKGGAFWEATI